MGEANGDYVAVHVLRSRVQNIFLSCGVRRQTAASVANVIVAGERDDCKSHGIYRIEGCLRALRLGRVEPLAVPKLYDSGSAILEVDAEGGFSCPAFDLARGVLTSRACELGLATLTIRDALHFSALWFEVEELVASGFAVLSMCPSYAFVAPYGGHTPVLGTNPIAFGWPRPGKKPYIFDFATSVAARGEIEIRELKGMPIPEGWAIDTLGRPTTDAAEALSGAMLPFGKHKGSAVSTMIELLAGAMLGEFMSKEALDFSGGGVLPRHGALIIAFDPKRFAKRSGRDPLEEGEKLLTAIADQGARLPSQRRFLARKKALRDGIFLSREELRQLDAFEEFGLDALPENIA